jgi:NADH dehydrogenase FAD-containing subunit
MKKHLVLAGGGHAHLKVILKLQDYVKKGYRVTLVSPSPYLYYSAMGPGMLSGRYELREIRFNVKKMSEDRGATFLLNSIIEVNSQDHKLQLQNGNYITYDVVSFNTGSDVAINTIDETEKNIFTAKPIENLMRAREYILDFRLSKRMNILVVGGGPAGVEIAANVWKLTKDNRLPAHITIISASLLLKNYPRRIRELAERSLERKGIEIIEHKYLKSLTGGHALMEDGQTKQYDVAFLATGIKPSSIFRRSGLPVGEDGGLSVNSYLQCISYPEMFGGGDCINFQDRPLPKVGVYAVRESEILYHNLLAFMEDGRLKKFEPQRSYMLIMNTGDGRGILWKNGFVWNGRSSFILKNYIDRKWMKNYQVSGEAKEQTTLGGGHESTC